MSNFPTVKQAAGSAIGSRCEFWHWRPSSRSRTGFVLVATFSTVERAAAFAKRWAARLGVSMFFRRVGEGFTVSVPVNVPS
jgi:hypothetical protein